MRYVIDRFAAEYVSGFDLVHSGNYCFTERELPKIKAAGVPISFDFSDDSTDEYFEQIAPFVTYAFMSMGDASLEDIKAKLEWVKALGPQIVCASRGSKGSVAYDGENFYEQGIKPVAPEELKDAMAAGDSLLTAFLVTYLSRRGRRVRRGRNSRDGLRCRFCGADLQDRGQLGHRWSTRTSFCRGGVSWGARIALGVKMSVRACAAGFCCADVYQNLDPLGCIQGASQERFEGCFLSI
ncbi:MAG: PfkB family carbohydrate kinase [Collinsella sp.]